MKTRTSSIGEASRLRGVCLRDAGLGLNSTRSSLRRSRGYQVCPGRFGRAARCVIASHRGGGDLLHQGKYVQNPPVIRDPPILNPQDINNVE